MKIKVYRNEDVSKVIAFIPRGHRHIRLLVEFKDEVIVLQEATVAGIVRAYLSVLLHPQRKAIELVQRKLSKSERKQGYAEYQLVEVDKRDEEILDELSKILLCLNK